jgi:DnaJ-class molecular chaperone
MDHFKTLGVSSSATADDVKTAFRKLALEYHPDRHASASPSEREAAAARFKVRCTINHDAYL